MVSEEQVSATFYSSSAQAGQYMSANGSVVTAGYGMSVQTQAAGAGQGAPEQMMFGGMGQQEGLTPIGEGMFRELMGIGGGFGGVWDGGS